MISHKNRIIGNQPWPPRTTRGPEMAKTLPSGASVGPWVDFRAKSVKYELISDETWGPKGASDSQVLGCFRPPWGPLGLRLGSNYPFFIWDQFLLNTFGSRIDPRARRWPSWPSFGRFRPSCGPRWSWTGLNYPFFIGNQLIFLTFCSRIDPRPKDGPDGQVLAVSGSHVVLGGRKGVQNDPYNFLLPPDFIKICSKWLPWGCRWPLPSPCCSSGGHSWNPEFLGFSIPVDLPEHKESGLVSVSIFEILQLHLVAQCITKGHH